MYYLKYRPKQLTELDNTNIKETVSNILKSKQLPHAFLFIGQKGTGKTSTARIFAKAVNCLNNAYAGKGDSIEPCNTCHNCKSIDASSSADVVELDAASNRGIEEVKSLIKEAAFLPMTGRYRVFIIDEAHMITHDAFNALLKTLEEPPASVIFIMATTNEEKVPKTIASRCVIIPFGKAKKADVISMLKRVLVQEKVTVSDDVLQLIANHSEKSFRDATKILEELVMQQKLTKEDAQKYLGIRSKQNLLTILEKNTLKDALSWIEEFNAHNGSIKNLLEDLLEELRNALLAKNGVLSQEETYSFTSHEIATLMKLFTEAYSSLRLSPIESIPLEIAIVEFYNKRKA